MNRDRGSSEGLELFCVLGMHRSGTSLTAGALQRLGVHFGSREQMDRPKRENPAGFFEHVGLRHLDVDLMEALGGSWADPPPLEPGWERDRRIQGLRDRASAFVETFGTEVAAPRGWKDPRLSLLLPFWRDFVSPRGIVVVIRDPAEVAVSLARRNGFHTEHAAYLWIRYTAAAWTSAGNPLLVDHSSYWDDLDATVDRLREFVGSDLHPDAARAAVNGLFDQDLRRSVIRPDQLNDRGQMYALARFTYELIRSEEPRVFGPILNALRDGWTQVPEYREALDRSRLAERLPVRLGLRVADAVERFRRNR